MSHDQTSTDTATPSADTSYPKNLVLDIGGRKFKVARNTLEEESGLFQRQFSVCYSWTPELDGSYFLDADPDLFEHLLRYMRRPEVFPLFYSVMNGFDYDLYNHLQAEALYFQIKKLYEWIEAKSGALFHELSKCISVHVEYDLTEVVRTDVVGNAI
ncbi:uncharacterized protein J4E79_001273 [Alternaria viburni]|uniref:uncharacterized protein n=1 Tax=Alternaria viburni TaxID=566460 RepID=UPI0020C2C159|nr:uncharacterized protein J4E79_001273 [Alternaria viburni]KAI4669230.1 hypothetical protein J4E79_001273 [Alternaria viburni]